MSMKNDRKTNSERYKQYLAKSNDDLNCDIHVVVLFLNWFWFSCVCVCASVRAVAHHILHFKYEQFERRQIIIWASAEFYVGSHRIAK